jgi:hypothetical protein
MGVPQSVIKQRLEEAGIRPIEDQVEATTDLYNLIDEQLSGVPPLSLQGVEPGYIQPTRSGDASAKD